MKVTYELTGRQQLTLESALSSKMIDTHNKCKELDGYSKGHQEMMLGNLYDLKATYNAINKSQTLPSKTDAKGYLESYEEICKQHTEDIEKAGF